MDSTRTDSLPTASETHVSGADLMAVAEGDASHQPSEAALNHIFSCPRCSVTVREIRQGLASFGAAAAKPTTRPSTRTAGDPTVLDALDARGDLKEARVGDLDPAQLLGSFAERGGAEGEADYDRSRRLVVKVIVVGVVLALGMLWMKSFASGLQ